jgi:nucleoside-diphosphate-sugar epimerase
MKIVLTGGTGLIGSKSVAILRQGGHEVIAAMNLVRALTSEGGRRWKAKSGTIRP